MCNFSVSQEVPLKNIRIMDSFWTKYQRLVREEVIPYQWKALNDQVEGAEPMQIFIGIQVVDFYCLNYAVNGSTCSSSHGTPAEQPVLSTDREGADVVFAQ